MTRLKVWIAWVAIALAFAAYLDGGERPRRKGWLGMALVLRSDTRGEKFLYVAQAPENAPAYKAGVRQGDLITAIEGKRITFRDDLDIMEFTSALKVGTTLKLRAVRSGKPLEIPSESAHCQRSTKASSKRASEERARIARKRNSDSRKGGRGHLARRDLLRARRPQPSLYRQPAACQQPIRTLRTPAARRP